MSALLKRKPSPMNASRIAFCAGSGCTLIGSRSPESTARAISSSVLTPMFIPRSACPSIIVIGVSQGISRPNCTACTAFAFSSKAPPSRLFVNSMSCLYSWSPLSTSTLAWSPTDRASICWSTDPPWIRTSPWTTPPGTTLTSLSTVSTEAPPAPRLASSFLNAMSLPLQALRVNL